jgi:hypothetical protein
MERALHPPTDIHIMEEWMKPDGSCSVSCMYRVNRQPILWYEYHVGTQSVQNNNSAVVACSSELSD